jgi:YHS domain-containing protein
MCPGIFGKDPEKYLVDAGIRVPSAVDRRHPARIEPAFRTFVNHELYYVANASELTRLRRDPLRYVGKVTDPVSRQRFQPDRRSPRAMHLGRLYFFQDPLNLRTFKALPDTFAVRKGA